MPRRVLFLEAQKALNCFSCSPEPQSLVCPLFIAFPYPRPAPPSSSWGPEGTLGPCLTSRAVSGQLDALSVRSVSKPVSPPRGLPAVTQLQFFSFKEQQEKQTRRPWLCSWTEGPDNCRLSSPLFPSPATLCPSVLESRVLLRPGGGRPGGMP